MAMTGKRPHSPKSLLRNEEFKSLFTVAKYPKLGDDKGKMLNQTVMDGCHDNTSDDVVLVLEDDTSPTKSVQISNQDLETLVLSRVRANMAQQQTACLKKLQTHITHLQKVQMDGHKKVKDLQLKVQNLFFLQQHKEKRKAFTAALESIASCGPNFSSKVNKKRKQKPKVTTTSTSYVPFTLKILQSASSFPNSAMSKDNLLEVPHFRSKLTKVLMHPSTQSLPQVITCKLPGASKPLPPQPKLEVSFSQSDGVILSCFINQSNATSEASSYKLFVYEKRAATPKFSTWRTMADIKAATLPLTAVYQMMRKDSERSYFAMRVVDINGQLGSLSNIVYFDHVSHRKEGR